MSHESSIPPETAKAVEAWLDHFEAVVGWLLPKAVAGDSRSLLTPVPRSKHAVAELLALLADEPNDLVVTLARLHSLGPVGSPSAPSAIEACVELVRSLVWFVDSILRDGEAPSHLVRTKGGHPTEVPLDAVIELADVIRSEVAKHVTKKLVTDLRAGALAELAKIPLGLPTIEQKIANLGLEDQYRLWIKTVEEIHRDGKIAGHDRIATRAKRSRSWSQDFPRPLRKKGILTNKIPKAMTESFEFTPLGQEIADYLVDPRE